MRITRHRVLTAAIAILVIVVIYTSSHRGEGHKPNFTPQIGPYAELLSGRQREIKDAFQHSWNGYVEHCFGHDNLHPVSNTCDDDFGGWGASAIDALSTAILFRNKDAVLKILHFIQTIDFTIVAGGTNILFFEVAIRHFAGMISAYDLLHHGPFSDLLDGNAYLLQSILVQMTGLGDILSSAFLTNSGVPHLWLNPKLREGAGGTSAPIAIPGTTILEFMRLSDITGNRTYGDLAKKATGYLLDPAIQGEPFPGLLGSSIDIESGNLISNKGSWGALSDSFYEYLLKAYVYDQSTFKSYLGRWKMAADSTIRHVSSHPYGHPEWTLLPYWEGQKLFHRMDALSWFAGGSFIYGGMVTKNQTLVDFGLSIADTGGAIYQMSSSGLGGEYVSWTPDCTDWGEGCSAESSLRVISGTFNLRPEVLETWYYAYRATKDRKYQDWAWSVFQAMQKYCRTSSGFAGLEDVDVHNNDKKLDKQESFVYAEVLKYLYLIHLEDPDAHFQVQDSRQGTRNTWVYNTEAHPFRVAGRPV